MKESLLAGLGHIFTAIAIVILAVLIFVVGMAYLPLSNRFLDLKARQDCASSYSLQYNDKNTNTIVTRPIDDLYAKCLTEKGI